MSDPLVEQRRLKLAAWKERFGYGYAEKFDRTHTSAQAKEAVETKSPRVAEDVLADPKATAKLCGRIINLRDMGKLAFLRIRDRAGDFQICLSKAILEDDYKPLVKLLDLGDFCGFEGEFFITKHGEPTLLVTQVIPLAKTLRPLPEKFHGLNDKEACYRQRYLDLITNEETRKRFQIRSQVIREIRNFLEAKDFMEVETRILQAQAGGALAKVFKTHHEALDHEFVLRIALELDLKMTVVGGFERVFEIGKCFRNEGIDPSHLQEFTMLEWYAAYENLETNMQWTEELLQGLIQKVLDTTKITVLDKDEQPVEIDFSGTWKRVRFPDLLKEHAQLDMFKASRKEVEEKALEYGADKAGIQKISTGNLLDHIYKKSARPTLLEPTFVMDYPSELKPLARPKGDGTADCYQLLVAGWEIVNSYGELVDPEVQRTLLEAQSASREAGDEEAMQVDEEFLTAMEHGMPPMTGSGIGVGRLVTLLTGQANLRDTVLFPQMKPERKQLSSKEAETRYRSKKVIVIADEALNPGIVANAIGQLGVSIGGHSTQDLFDIKILHDQERRVHYVDCLYPMANLAGDQKQMAEFAQKCYAADIQFFDFTDIMRKAHSDKQMLEGYKSQKTKDLGYIAVGAIVPKDFEKEFLATLKRFGDEA